MELLTTGLSELCKAKPHGVEAVKWLGEWLLANNPNQPNVEEPDQ
jgi:Dpy-30 motif